MPEGGVIPGSHAHPRQVLVALQLVGDEFAKIRIPGRLPAEIRVCEEPLFPRERLGVMELVHKLQEEAVIHISEIFDTKATKLFRLAHVRPSHQAAGAMALFLTSQPS